MKTQTIKFSNNKQQDFSNELRRKVMNYFEENKISKYGNKGMVVKTIFMFSLYLVPYLLMMTGIVSNPVVMLFLWMTMGFGMSGIGFSVMHDANHNSYSKNQKVNKVLSYTINFLGGFTRTWQHQHNTMHHHYTNIDDFDEDIDPGKVLRLSPGKPLRKFHRFQHYYAWFLYGLMTMTWSTNKDFKQLFRYKKEGVSLNRKRSWGFMFTELAVSKAIYYLYILVLPMLLLPIPWWTVLLFYFIMHFIAGSVLGIVFQTAHVMPSSEYPVPDEQGTMENNWTIHQMMTTSDYAPKSRFFSWFIGGLNFQVEHHLFPAICHIHYKAISTLVKQTAEQYQLPYYVQPTFFQALLNHQKMLKTLGR